MNRCRYRLSILIYNGAHIDFFFKKSIFCTGSLVNIFLTNATEKYPFFILYFFPSYFFPSFFLSLRGLTGVSFKHFVPACMQMVYKTRKDQLSIEKNNDHTTDACVSAQNSTVKPV